MTLYGYTRVSTGRQVESGLGLAAQRAAILQYARARYGRRVQVQLHIERGVSAASTPFARRPAGARIDAAAGVGDHVIVAKLDRAWRNVRDCAACLDRWQRRGIIVHLLDVGAATDTPAGRLLLQIMAAIAEWESRRIGERIRAAHDALRARGLHPSGGAPPLGYRVRRRRLVVDIPARRLIALVVHARRRRRRPLPYAVIAGWLNSRGCRSASGRAWNGASCRRAALHPEAARWARRYSPLISLETLPTTGYRHAAGAPKRAARLRLDAAQRQHIARLGALHAQRRRES